MWGEGWLEADFLPRCNKPVVSCSRELMWPLQSSEV